MAVPTVEDPSPCASLLSRLGSLDGLSRRPVTPASPLTGAWGRPPVTLSCGSPVPAHPAGQLALCIGSCTDGVQWFEDALDVTLYATRVSPVVEVHIPDAYGVADVLDPISRALLAASPR